MVSIDSFFFFDIDAPDLHNRAKGQRKKRVQLNLGNYVVYIEKNGYVKRYHKD